MPDAVFKINNQVNKRQKHLKETIFIDLSAITNPIERDPFLQWAQVGQMLDWMTGVGIYLRMEGRQDRHEADIGGMAVVAPSRKQAMGDDYKYIYYRTYHENMSKTNETDDPTVEDANDDVDPSKDEEPAGYQEPQHQCRFEEAPHRILGGYGDSVNKIRDECQEKAEQPAQCDDDDKEERIIRVEHLWPSNDDIEHNTIAPIKAGQDTPTARTTVDNDDDDDAMLRVPGLYGEQAVDDEEHSTSISAMTDHVSSTAGTTVDNNDDDAMLRVPELYGEQAVDDEEHSKSVQAVTDHVSPTATTTVNDDDDDDDAMFGVLGLYACGQAGVFF